VLLFHTHVRIAAPFVHWRNASLTSAARARDGEICAPLAKIASEGKAAREQRNWNRGFSSTNAVSFSSARTMKRFPSRCASAIQIVRPPEAIAETQPQLQPPLLRIGTGFRLRFGNEFLKIWIVAQRVRPERGKRAAELPGKANALHQILKSPIRTDGFELRRNVQINEMERVLRVRFFQ
jgi:hypothetical protein